MDFGAGDLGETPDRRRAPPFDQEREEPRWGIALRNALGTGLGSFVGTLPLRALGLVPETVVVRIFAIVTLAAAIVYLVRWEMHVEIAYRNETGGRLHVVVVTCEGVVAVLFVACGPVCFFWPSGIGQFIAASVLLLAGFSLDLAMSWLVRNRDIKTGTDVASHCGLVRFIRVNILEPVDSVKAFDWLNRRWELKAPWGKVSFLGLWLWATMVTVATANAPRVVPPVYQFFKDSGQKPSAEKAKAKVSGASILGGVEGMAAPGAHQAAEPEVRQPTPAPHLGYYEQCGSNLVPGEPAPQPQRRQLYDQWLGPAGLGAVFAGCAKRARRESNGVWYALGTCDDSIRSLAVAAPGGAGELLLWAPARFGLARAREGTLMGATSSRLVGRGEIYSVTTEAGTYLFMRDRLSDGTEGRPVPPESCHEVDQGGVPYVTLPPALTRLWSTRLDTQGEWLWPVSEARTADGGTDYAFRDPNPTDNREIVGHCESATKCELRIGPDVSHSAGAGAADVAAILAQAPGA